MGVHGLTTYLRERKRLLSATTVLSAKSNNPVPIVVDGWSFIYDLYNSHHLPWVYGGEYAEFERLVKTVVESWIRVGLQVYFVFDGACPDLKFPTVISRLAQSHIQPAQLFFRTSSVSRSTGRFLNETRILPPLAYSTCIHALEAVRSETGAVDLHFADEEGDPYAVELAARLGGYVLGNDSDFVILNSAGYRGYIPLDELTVTKPKAKKKATNLSHAPSSEGLLPPENLDREELSISFVSYSPNTLADHLNIPVTLLPLLGALVGNDFSKEVESNSRKIQGLFFERSLTLAQRIEKVASTIRSAMSPSSQRRKAKHQVGSVMDLIDRTVNALLSRLTTTMGSGEIDAIVDKIVNATLQYAIPKYAGELEGKEGLWATSVCALHDPETCSLLPMISRNVMRQAEESENADPRLLEAREKYLDAYRCGLLSPKNMDILNTGSSWARLFLENPDQETVGRSIGRPIREWVHAILHDAVGLEPSELAESIDGEEVDAEESDPDELVDVVESDSDGSDSPSGRDFLAPLKGALQRLHNDDYSESEATEPPASAISHRRVSTAPPIVTEYLRRGTRIAAETVTVTPFRDLLTSISLPEFAKEAAPPLVLRSEEDRLTILLRILQSDVQAVRSLPPEAVLPVVALRWVIRTLHVRWEETGSKEREKERWTRSEARCFLSSLSWAPNQHLSGDQTNTPFPPIEDRNIQLIAQILMALGTIEQLSQALLLSGRIPSNFHQLSGKAFHARLTGTASSMEISIPNGIWEAAEVGLEDSFQEERVKNTKKPKKAHKLQVPISTPQPTKLGGQKGNSIYALLGDIEA
ncbi:unnamed protein product [Cyclocybe aegerita]|uniref:Asteroid domain-containing protein n=1 Tax=Cyclocybe aegerita TaxID=1973307 RepID=A0A8S0WUR8_CYCAE|nr:unnamed protein product [Cyclocybe aegerita]